jgi:hypothetical protein
VCQSTLVLRDIAQTGDGIRCEGPSFGRDPIGPRIALDTIGNERSLP